MSAISLATAARTSVRGTTTNVPYGPCSISLIGTPPNGGYLKGKSLTKYFPYVDLLSGVRETASPEYASLSPFMRPGKILTYTGRSQKIVDIGIKLVTEPGAERETTETLSEWWGQLVADVSAAFDGDAAVSNQTADAWYSVVARARWLSALMDSYIDGSDPTTTHAPPAVILNMGALSYVAVVARCEIAWRGPWYHSEHGDQGLELGGTNIVPGQADVSMSFSVLGTP